MLKSFVCLSRAAFFLLGLGLFVSGQAALAEENAPAPAVAPAPQDQSVPREYLLGVGDRVKLVTFGEADLSGEFEISSTGVLSLPLMGDVHAAGLTVAKLRSTIITKLKDGYMKDPKISLEVAGYRPFFIVGEVMRPGSYNYVNGMTIINAVALAGGYTYRADKEDIAIKRKGEEKTEKARETDTVMPGDVVTVSERFF